MEELCWVCFSKSNALHYHHVKPQARGGTDGETVPLCSSCHNELHKIALSKATVAKGGKSKVCQQWSNCRHELEIERANFLIGHIVRALLSEYVPVTKKVIIDLPVQLAKALDIYKVDMKISSREKAIIYLLSKLLLSK